MNEISFFASSLWKNSLRCSFLMAMLFAIQLQAEDESPIPHAWPAARYEKIKRQSPFALATPVEPTAEPQASFASNWFVSGIGRMGGEDFVTIKARDLSTQFSLYGHEANAENGVALASVEWSDKIGKSTVVITKGTETAKLEFNEAEISGPPQVTVAEGGNVKAKTTMPARSNPLPTPPSRISTGRLNDQFPGNRKVIAPPSHFPLQGQPRPGGAPMQGQDRRRIPIINTPQHP